MKLRIVPLLLNFFLLAFASKLHAQQVAINEFMFAPASGGFEWVELFNPGPEEINLNAWTLRDKSGGGGIIINDDLPVPVGGYVIIASGIPLAAGWESPPAPVLLPQSFPSLNNSGDDISLRDAEGNLIDSLTYTGSWSAQRGVSTERLRHDLPPVRENWSASIAASGGTPGVQNSVCVTPVDPLPRYALLINEIMPAPLGFSCEWVEIYNPGPEAIDLSRWTLAGKIDNHGSRPGILLPNNAGEIAPFGFAVIAADSTLIKQFPDIPSPPAALLIVLNKNSLSLGNAGDELLLLDPTGACIDSMWYSDDWHSPFLPDPAGISLELLQPGFHLLGADAWSSCTARTGGTPGMRNSIYSEEPLESNSGDASLSVSPNPFSPDGDGQEDFCLFRCRLPSNVNQVRVRIYDVEGRQIATLLNNQPMGRDGMVVWDGLDSEGRRARVGAYVALLEGLDPYSNSVVAVKSVVVVARRL